MHVIGTALYIVMCCDPWKILYLDLQWRADNCCSFLPQIGLALLCTCRVKNLSIAAGLLSIVSHRYWTLVLLQGFWNCILKLIMKITVLWDAIFNQVERCLHFGEPAASVSTVQECSFTLRWRQQVSPKCWTISTKLQSIIFQGTWSNHNIHCHGTKNLRNVVAAVWSVENFEWNIVAIQEVFHIPAMHRS